MITVFCIIVAFGAGIFAGGYLATNGVYGHMDDLYKLIKEKHDDSNYSKGIMHCFECMANKIGYKGE